MENVYVLVAYVATVMALAGCVVMKVGDILERRRDEKHYKMIKNDVVFWQMKVEMSAMRVLNDSVDMAIERLRRELHDMEILTEESEKTEEKTETQFDLDDEKRLIPWEWDEWDEDDEEIMI